MVDKILMNRRSLLKWTTPALAAVALPAHAQASPVPEECVPSVPVLSIESSPKCAGSPPVGTATISIVSSGNGTSSSGAPESLVTIKSLTLMALDSDNILTNLPTFPADIDATNAISFNWEGPGSDALTCLPISQLDVEVEYCCEDGPSEFISVDLTQLLIASI